MPGGPGLTLLARLRYQILGLRLPRETPGMFADTNQSR